MPDTTLTSAELAEALANLTDAFLKVHGRFPLDRVTPEQEATHLAMKEAYRLIGQPGTNDRKRKLSLARAGIEAGKAEEWLPIETLPPEADGTSIIVAAWNGTEYTVAEVTAIAGGFRWLWSGTDPDDDDRWLSDDGFEPTHWRPLPAPPAIRALPLTGVDKP